MDAPYLFNYIDAETSKINPSTVHCRNTNLSRYFERKLIQKAMSVFEWTLPETWDSNYTLYTLYYLGFFAIVNTDRFGVIPQNCGLGGQTVLYQPRYAIITNPLLRGILRPIINKQCVIMRLQPDYGGVYDTVSYYADMLALCAEAIGMNLVNSKLSYIFGSANKTQSESFKKLFDNIQEGNPATFVDNNLYRDDGAINYQMFNQNVGQNYIADRILSDMRKIEAQFCTDIGIPNANTDKRERLISDEVNANSFETRSRCEMWLEELQKSCAKAREMFDINIDVKWRTVQQEAGKQEGVTI